MAQLGEKNWCHKIGGASFTESLLFIVIEEEQFHTLPTVELCETNVGQTHIE